MGVKAITLDKGLEYVQTNGTVLLICDSDPADYAAAVAAAIGNKTGVSFGAPEAHGVSGRKIALGTQTGGNITDDATADFWAITNGSNELYATGDITDQVVTNGNTFSTTAAIEIRLGA